MMNIYVPELVSHHLFDFLGRIDNDELYLADCVNFNFSCMRWFYPLPMLVLGSYIRNLAKARGQTGLITQISGYEGHTYPGTMGFYKYISEYLEIGKAPGEAHGGKNYIPITHISVDSLRNSFNQGLCIEDGDLIEKEAGRLASVIARENAEWHKIIQFILREIIRNTPEHAGVNDVWVCAQFWPSSNKASIGIIDEGMGVYKSLTRNKSHQNYVINNNCALEWALKPGISQSLLPSKKPNQNSIWDNSGFGLYLVSQICAELNGNFILASEDGYARVNRRGLEIHPTKFHGTAVEIEISTANITDAQQLISNMGVKGEEIAKTIRGAFKKASIPSRGLMEQLGIQNRFF